MAKSEDRYVVGYKNGKCWGTDGLESIWPTVSQRVAKRLLSEMPDQHSTIYRLQPMKLVDGKLVPDEGE